MLHRHIRYSCIYEVVTYEPKPDTALQAQYVMHLKYEYYHVKIEDGPRLVNHYYLVYVGG